jgi:hypothetical protein
VETGERIVAALYVLTVGGSRDRPYAGALDHGGLVEQHLPPFRFGSTSWSMPNETSCMRVR